MGRGLVQANIILGDMMRGKNRLVGVVCDNRLHLRNGGGVDSIA